MQPKIAYWQLLLSIMVLGLAGCAEFNQRKGLEPVMDGASVQNASYNKFVILNALARDAGYGEGQPVDYYNVAEAGFNYVDDQCRAYFDRLFFINRGREQFKNGLTAASQTTAAILGVTGAAAPSLAIVAQAFGFAANATDIVAGTYLYELPPATTQGFVEKLQLAFRDAAAAKSARINTPTAAYYYVQRYLNLCLPPTIEAEITRQISSATAFSVPSSGGASFSIETASAPSLSVTSAAPVSRSRFIGSSPIPRQEVRNARIAHVTEPVQPVTPISRQTTQTAFVRQVQAALCVSQPDGIVDDSTRKAIQMYLAAKNQKTPDPIDPLDPVLRTRLQKAVDDVRDCSREGYRNAYEVGLFGVPSELKSNRIKDFQKKIDEFLKKKGSGITIVQTGKFDQQTRNGISEVRRLTTGTNGDQIDPDLENEIID